MTKIFMTLSALVLMAFANDATAKTWVGTSSDDWLDPLNWDDNIPPQGPVTSFSTYGTGGDLVVSATATYQPVANAGETIGGTVINNYQTGTPGGMALITFESGSYGDFYNMGGADSDPTAVIEYDIQSGAVVDVANEITHSYSSQGALNITLGGTINASTYFNGGNGRGYIDILMGGLLTLPGDVTGSVNTAIGNGYIYTSTSGHVTISEYDSGSDTTSVFAEEPLFPLGDFNKSGSVDPADYGIMKSNWLTSGHALNENGEVTGDGLVSLKDFALFKDQLYTGDLSALGAIPEPSALSLVLIATLQGCISRRRYRVKQ